MKLLTLTLITTSLLSYSAAALTSKVSYELRDSLNTPVNEDRVKNWLSFEVESQKSKRRNLTYFEGSARYYHSRDDYMYSLPEFYYKRDSRDNSTNFWLGRKVVDWNKYEGFWGLNHINPQRSYDLLDTKREGLTGIYVDQKISGNLRAQIFFSYLYIPQLNPGVKVENGRVTSSADWYITPPSKMQMKGQTKPIIYQINMPKISDVVFQKSMGINLKYETSSFMASAYSFFKPENKLRLNARGMLDETVTPHVGRVTANPIVNYHGIYGLVTRSKIGPLQNYLGVEIVDSNTRLSKLLKSIDPMRIEPEERSEKEDDFDIRPSYISQTYLHYSTKIPQDTYSISLNYIRLLSTESIQKDSFYQEASKFLNAVGIGGEYSFTDHLKASVRWYYDFEREDNIIKSELGWSNKYLSVLTGVELLKAENEDSYWSDYRTNDSIYSKFSFLF